MRSIAGSGLLAAVLGVVTSAMAGRPVEAIKATGEVSEERLLDVGIQVFDPGIPAGVAETELAEKGIFSDIRRSEARYVANQLKTTLQSTGYWGAVRTVPKGASPLDVNVTGDILLSNGKHLELAIRVHDATGRRWLKRTYRQEADPRAYDDQVEVIDPFQNLYNRIANDLLGKYRKLDGRRIAAVRELTRLRFAAEIAPTAYADYLKVDRKGRYRVERLPAAGDPMVERIARIRERDGMLVDTLNQHYDDFHLRMEASYGEWRKFSYAEQVALEKLQSSARKRKILGAVAIFGGIFVGGDSREEQAARDAAILAGVAAIQSGLEKDREAEIHRAALGELATSFDAEVKPILVEVEDRTVELTGSAETQFASWRQLLSDIFSRETGLPTDPNQAGAAVPDEPQADVATASP